MDAAEKGASEAIALLVERKDDFKTEYANFNHVTDRVSMTMLHLAAKRGKVHVVDQLLKNNDVDIDVNSIDDFGSTPLYVAAMWGKLDVVERLMEHEDIIIDVVAGPRLNRTPLLDAAMVGHVHVVKYLLSGNKRANIRAQDSRGYTILHHAAMMGQLAVIEYILSGLAIKDSDRRWLLKEVDYIDNKTPASLARDCNKDDAFHLLNKYH